MKKTTVQWFCDRCNREMKAKPDSVIFIDNTGESSRVIIEHYRSGVCEYNNSMLCDECKACLLEMSLKNSKRQRRKAND